MLVFRMAVDLTFEELLVIRLGALSNAHMCSMHEARRTRNSEAGRVYI